VVVSDGDPVPPGTAPGALADRESRLPEGVQRLLVENQGVLNKALAEQIKELCDAAYTVGYERGWHDGWDAAEAEAVVPSG
jgi:hypothetical protein